MKFACFAENVTRVTMLVQRVVGRCVVAEVTIVKSLKFNIDANASTSGVATSSVRFARRKSRSAGADEYGILLQS